MVAEDDEAEDRLDAQFKREALHYAAGQGELSQVKALLAEGYPINGFGDLSWMPLRHAARNERLDVVRHLIAAGADPTITGWMGLTALDKCENRKRGGGPEVRRLLLEAAKRRHPGWARLAQFSPKPTKKAKRWRKIQVS